MSRDVAILAVGLLVAMPLTLGPLTATDLCLLIAIALAALGQVSWTWRYLAGAPLEVPRSTGLDAPGRIALLTTKPFSTAWTCSGHPGGSVRNNYRAGSFVFMIGVVAPFT